MTVTRKQLSEAAGMIRHWLVTESDKRPMEEVMLAVFWGPKVAVGDTLHAARRITVDVDGGNSLRVLAEQGDAMTVIHAPEEDQPWKCYVKTSRCNWLRVSRGDVANT